MADRSGDTAFIFTSAGIQHASGFHPVAPAPGVFEGLVLQLDRPVSKTCSGITRHGMKACGPLSEGSHVVHNGLYWCSSIWTASENSICHFCHMPENTHWRWGGTLCDVTEGTTMTQMSPPGEWPHTPSATFSLSPLKPPCVGGHSSSRELKRILFAAYSKHRAKCPVFWTSARMVKMSFWWVKYVAVDLLLVHVSQHCYVFFSLARWSSNKMQVWTKKGTICPIFTLPLSLLFFFFS